MACPVQRLSAFRIRGMTDGTSQRIVCQQVAARGDGHLRLTFSRRGRIKGSVISEGEQYKGQAMSILGMWTPGGVEIVVILVIALLLFGNRLPQVARSLGKGLLEFKRGLRGFTEEVKSATDETEDAETKPIETSASESTEKAEDGKTADAEKKEEKKEEHST